jgi:hypothetical protein
MFKAIVVCLLVLVMQTGFYLKAGDQVSFYSGYPSILSNNLSKDVLFVVKHSKSPNMVVYQAKRTLQNDLDPQKPIDVYWLMQTKGAKTEAVTMIEWKMAFGFKLQTILKREEI